MIKAKSLEELAEMLETARKKSLKINPVIEIIETGLYHVEGSKGNWYHVRCGRTPDGYFFIACDCRGALESKACYHSSKAFYLHQKVRQAEIASRQKIDENKMPYFSGGNRQEKPTEKVGNVKI